MREYNMEHPLYASMAERSLSGFTPINPNGAVPRFINPVDTLRHASENELRHILPDSDNHSDEDSAVNEVLYSKSRKKRNKSVMLDLQEGLDEIEGLAKKKLKPVQQRSKSTISPTRFSELVIEEPVVPHNERLETPLPALKTKSKPKSRAKSKTTPKNITSASKDKKQAHFKAPTITNSFPVEKVELTPVIAQSFPVSKHPSLTTTENAIKGNSQGVLLSKTTMSKLHSFLYVPSIPHVASAFSLPAQVAYPISELRPAPIKHTAFTELSSEYEPDPNYNNVLGAHDEDATTSMRAGHGDSMHNSYSPDMPSAYAMVSSHDIFPGEPSRNHPNYEERGYDRTQTRHTNEFVISAEVETLVQTQDNLSLTLPTSSTQPQLAHGEPFQDLPVSKPDVDEYSSSEVKAFTQLLDQTERPLEESSNHCEESSGIGTIAGVEAPIKTKDDHPDPHEVIFKSYSDESTREEQPHGLLPPFTQNTYRKLDEGSSRLRIDNDEPLLSDEEVLLFDDQRDSAFNKCIKSEGTIHGGSLLSGVAYLYDDSLPSEGGDFEEDFDEEAILLDGPLRSAINQIGNQLEDEDLLFDDHMPFEIEFGNGFDQGTPFCDDEITSAVEFGDELYFEVMLLDEHTPAKKAVMDQTAPSEFDEFDDGVDDSDILEMLSANPVIVVNPPSVYSREERIPNVASEPDAAVAVQQGRTTNGTSPTVLSASNVSQTVDLHEDDEFPMDRSDEEEMLKLPVITPDSRHLELSPPRLLGDRHSGSGEAYSGTKQLSPDRSISRTPNQTQSSPNRLTSTPIASSQITTSEPRSDMLGEGEEWAHRLTDQVQIIDLADSLDDLEEEDPEVKQLMGPPPPRRRRSNLPLSILKKSITQALASKWGGGSSDYQPIQSFARLDFCEMVRDRCPVVGLSGQNFLRTCFKIGEMFKEAKRYSSFGQDAIIELFARVTFSSREAGTTRQYFVFADLWRDNPPFPEGMLMNYKTTGLADTESKAFVNSREPKMARCLGRLKRDVKNETGWLLHIITIRETDWEEIRYTKKAVCAGGIKSEPGQV